MASPANEDEVQRLVKHIFLPSQLPQAEEDEAVEISIIDITLRALVSLRDLLLPDRPIEAIDNAIMLLHNLKAVNSLQSGTVDESKLCNALTSLPPGKTLAVNIGAQNAAIMVTRVEAELVFETFELSPQNSAVIGSKGRLIRTFPDLAVAVNADLLGQSDFTTTVANTLSTMSQQKVPGMQPTSKKAGTQHEEFRDTTNPAVVSELFFGFLRGINSSTTPTVSSITKNTREEVLFANAEDPWRRSPMWLLIRVALQLVLSRSPNGSRRLYKEAMVYIMSYVLRSMPPSRSDILFGMTAKISRRVHKLSGIAKVLPGCVMTSVQHVLRDTSNTLGKRWRTLQNQDDRDMQLSELAGLDFMRDTFVSLPALDKYLIAIASRQENVTSERYKPSSQLLKHSCDTLPPLPSNNSKDCYYAAANLHQFEQWMSRHLDTWLATETSTGACDKIHSLMKQYHLLTSSLYCGNPEMQSVMILTVFELWVACDTMALQTCPLLAEFDPDIPLDVLQNLVLPSLGDMHRLRNVEEHVRGRRARSTTTTSELFSMGRKGFANKFFAQSRVHQELLTKIETEATVARDKKLEEFDRVFSEYHRLDTLHTGAECEYTTTIIDSWCDPPETVEKHNWNCAKCSYASQRDKLEIHVHEWPLPSDIFRARAVVFELRVPPSLAHWRDARSFFLQDVLRGQRAQLRPETSYLLSVNDPHLTQTHFRPSTTHPRIDLVSQTKPCVNTHYRRKQIGTLTKSDVCRPNGLQYEYYDNWSRTTPGVLTFQDTVARACTYTLSSPALQKFIFRPASTPDGPSPNDIIAGQDVCPGDMALDEYKELTAIPVGRRIQWANILLQLAMPGVDFKKSDTALTILQCINQAGPPLINDTLRESHQFLSSSENTIPLLQNLTNALQRVKENWESAQALRLFIAIAARALSLSPSDVVRSSCLAFLRNARKTAIDWMNDLREKAYTVTEHQDRAAFIAKRVEIALICTSTFDVDEDYIADSLVADGSTLLQCCIVIQEGEHSQCVAQDRPLALLLDMRHKRLLHRVYGMLAAHHLHAHLDSAIGKSWSGYAPSSSGWRAVSDAADHWLTTDTAATRDSPSMSVHYNLLDGELLVNGLPLDQPPKSYRETALYSTLFGSALVEVMPCMSPGFQFSTKRTFGEGYAVQLGMAGSDLTVRAAKEGRFYETIPSRVMQGFPTHFERDYVHWLDVDNNTVQFRPAEDAWNSSSPATWLLSKPAGHTDWQLSKAGQLLAGVHSATSRQISRLLDSLAHTSRIHNIVHPGENGPTLRVDIPTIRIGFTLNQGDSALESREYRSMVVDSNQNLGTLIGLRSKVMLRPAHFEGPQSGHRMVLIPHSANVLYRSKDGHVEVTADRSLVPKVHALHVDEELGRLIDNGDMGCKLYLAYLHALTSFCLVDPLTQKTGTEQALTILNGAAVRSFELLLKEEIDTLGLLASLSPGRRCYPLGKRVMQIVSWDTQLSFLSQHGHFSTAVQALLGQAERFRIFYPSSEAEMQLPNSKMVDQSLLHRDNIRAAVFRVSKFGAEDHSTMEDVQYCGRDRGLYSDWASRAAAMSCFMFRSGIELSELPLAPDQLWRNSVAYDRIQGPSAAIGPHKKARYHADALSERYDVVQQNLPAFHRWLSSPNAQAHRFSVMIWLSTIAATSKLDAAVLQTLGMMFKASLLSGVQAPEEASFSPKAGYECSKQELRQLLVSHRRSLHACPEYHTRREVNEKSRVYERRREILWQHASVAVVNKFVNALTSQWPCEVPVIPDIDRQSTYIDVSSAMEVIKARFKTWHDNKRLREWFTQIENRMSSFSVRKVQAVPPSSNVRGALPVPTVTGHVSEQDLFSLSAPSLPANPHSLELRSIRQRQSPRLNQPRLSTLVDKLDRSQGQSDFERKYIHELKESLDALQARSDAQPHVNLTPGDLTTHFNRCHEHAQAVYARLVAAVDLAREALPNMHAPRVSPAFFLQQLAHDRWTRLSSDWQESIVEYGVALTAVQRAVRLLRLADPSRKDDLSAELLNSGHQNWDPMDYPESLLIEVESGIMIREVQEDIAAHMRTPPHGDNAVMQLNMGEGKSSVIVPITAAALAGASGDQLVRVIVAKPQSRQMRQMLISKLGGLVNRRIYYMPFSRSLQLSEDDAGSICDMLRECTSAGGVLLVQPEHILSFQLMALESYIAGRAGVGRQLLSREIQAVLDSARDIVDESDENFSVHFELIYTMGAQCSIELNPDRWILVQQVLEVVRRLAWTISDELPQSLEYHSRGISGSFARIRILHHDAEAALLQRLADHVCEHGLYGLQVSRQPEAIRKAVYRYITQVELDAAEIRAVEESVFWAESTKLPLLLLRGYIAGGVLAFVFGQKRWRVNYGLTTAPRTPPTRLAVPYRAKDNPSPRSEFSHPDVVLTLTSLCYYYEGLSDDDLFTAMGHVMESDQSDIEYQAWVEDAHALPVAFHQLQGINLKDRPQCTHELFPALRYAKSVVDYFLSHIVFPKEMKEFPLKLSASGWDMGKSKKMSGGAVTGFSGTNDSRCLLPIDVGHLDLPKQKHTNALVLEHILQPDNGVVLMQPATDVHLSDAEHLLATTLSLDPPVQVILDVGAQILEMNNLEVAKTWLGKHDLTQDAAVFVNDSDEICVVDRNDRVELLRTSSFSNRLGSCLIFLDEAHTRGIDLQLPVKYRAAVTLGANLTKDRLVQAAMRMRKLGKGQTVVFCFPQEIQAKILAVTAKTDASAITTADVLHWAISESIKEIRRSMPLWSVQGERFVRQEALWQSSKADMSSTAAEQFQEEEAQSIEQRYRPRLTHRQPLHLLDSSDDRLQQIAKRCQEFEDLQFNSSTLQEEQERELSPEIEQERQVQRPHPATPAKHRLHPDVVRFAKQGVYSSTSKAYMSAFNAFSNSSAAKDFSVTQLDTAGKLLVTKDFVETIQRPGNDKSYVSDSYQRPVQWLLTTRVQGGNDVDRILVLSPFEANELYSGMKEYTADTAATLHMYKPRSNSGYATLDHLLFHTVSTHTPPKVPRALAIQLNLFAGQLYINTYDDYLAICQFLGLSTRAVTQELADQGWEQDAAGFVLRDDRGRTGGDSGLTKSPVHFFQIIMSKIRRNGESIVKTHMGALLEGKPFQEADFGEKPR